MRFELQIRDEKEYIDEIITHTHQTKKIWSKEKLQDEIIKLKEQAAEIQERTTELEEQLKRFSK